VVRVRVRTPLAVCNSVPELHVFPYRIKCLRVGAGGDEVLGPTPQQFLNFLNVENGAFSCIPT